MKWDTLHIHCFEHRWRWRNWCYKGCDSELGRQALFAAHLLFLVEGPTSMALDIIFCCLSRKLTYRLAIISSSSSSASLMIGGMNVWMFHFARPSSLQVFRLGWLMPRKLVDKGCYPFLLVGGQDLTLVGKLSLWPYTRSLLDVPFLKCPNGLVMPQCL